MGLIVFGALIQSQIISVFGELKISPALLVNQTLLEQNPPARFPENPFLF